MESLATKRNYVYLDGGGEMGELIRNYNWSATPIGSPEIWPQSLCTTLGILLHSAFPMFLFWGKELTCFYNDSFRPSLGVNGKHPAIGKQGKEVWPEIWEFIGPLLEQVMTTGQPVWFEDQLVPFYRNGRMEDIYWTFSYSPAYGDNGQVNGVFVTCTETTEKVATINELKESKDQLEFAIDAADLATWDFNPLANTFTANQRYCEWFGIAAEKGADNELALQVIADEDRERVITAYKKSLDYAIQSKFDIEYTIRPVGRPQRILRAKGKAWFNEEGIAYRFNGTLQDITDEATARKKLQASEQRVRALVESAPFPIGVYIGREMRIELANQAIMDVWDKGNDVVGKRYSEILPELGNQEIFEQLDHVFTTGKAFHAHNRRVDIVVDGRLQAFYFNYSFTPLFNEAGQVYGVMNTAAEVTDLIVAKQKVEEGERNFRNLVMQAPIGICIVSGDPVRVEIVNDSFLELVGKSRSQFEHSAYWEVLAEAADVYEPILKNVFTTGVTYQAKEHKIMLLRNGREELLHISFVFEPIKETDGSIKNVMILALDVSEQVEMRKKTEEIVTQRTQELAQANQALIKTNQELIRSNANLEEFAHAASHDMKEPIRKVLTFSDRLKSSLGARMNEKERHLFERMENATQRMGTLVDDLLEFSHVSERPPEMEDVDLNIKLRRALTDLELPIEEKRARINVGELPVVKGYNRQLQQLFQNLLSNALKYNKPGEAPEITVTSRLIKSKELAVQLLPEQQDQLFHLIKVKDNGIGFEQQYAERIFGMFQRLHGKAEYSGSGVGLSIARKVVENHNGYIWAESELGKGAAFNILLPANEL